MSDPPKALIDRLTLEVIEAAGSTLDPNVLITLAIKAGFHAAAGTSPTTAAASPPPTEPQPPSGASPPISAKPLPTGAALRRLTGRTKALRAAGMSVQRIAAFYDLTPDQVRSILRST